MKPRICPQCLRGAVAVAGLIGIWACVIGAAVYIAWVW